MLLAENEKTNNHAGIVDLFDTVFIVTSKIELATTFRELVYQINQNDPSEAFAKAYIQQGISFFDTIEKYRAQELANA